MKKIKKKAKFDTEEIAKIIGYSEDAELLRKEVSIIKSSSQLTIRIPKDLEVSAKINPKKDKFEFILKHSIVDGKLLTSLEGHLKRGK